MSEERVGDGFDHSPVCTVSMEELAADETPTDRDHVRAADAVDDAECHARLAAVCQCHGQRHTDALSTFLRRPSSSESPAAATTLPR